MAKISFCLPSIDCCPLISFIVVADTFKVANTPLIAFNISGLMPAAHLFPPMLYSALANSPEHGHGNSPAASRRVRLFLEGLGAMLDSSLSLTMPKKSLNRAPVRCVVVVDVVVVELAGNAVGKSCSLKAKTFIVVLYDKISGVFLIRTRGRFDTGAICDVGCCVVCVTNCCWVASWSSFSLLVVGLVVVTVKVGVG